MVYALTSVSTAGLEAWLERHIAHHWRVELITAFATLVFALSATVLAIVILAIWIGPYPEIVWLLPVGVLLVFASYPFVTPKRLPFMSWLREAHARDPMNDYPVSPFAVRYYFYDDYLALSALYWAPLFFHMAYEEFRKAFAIRLLDRRAVLAAMRLLAERDSRVMWYEFERALPAMPLESLQRQLSLVNGVVFLKNEPAGATLTDALREEIRALAG